MRICTHKRSIFLEDARQLTQPPSDAQRVELDYESLVSSYNENLLTVLRSFRVGHEFLELWVPDDDPHKSILNLAEAAESSGLPGLALTIGPEVRAKLDVDRLSSMVGGIGSLSVQPRAECSLLEFTFA